MFEKYRTLATMLSLGEFTVSDLVRASGVKEPTVRTVLNRRSDLVARAGFERTGRRGGSPVRYRLEDDARAQIRAELAELERHGDARAPQKDDAPAEIPSVLLAAEHLLLTRLPVTGGSERADLLALARTYVADSRTALSAESEGPVHANSAPHLALCQFLLRLEAAEDSRDVNPVSLWEDADELADALAGSEATELARSLRERVRSSSLFAAVLPPEKIVLVDGIEKENDDLTRSVHEWATATVQRTHVIALSAGDFEEELEAAVDSGSRVVVMLGGRRRHKDRSLAKVVNATGGRGFVTLTSQYDGDLARMTFEHRGIYSAFDGLSELAREQALAAFIVRPLS